MRYAKISLQVRFYHKDNKAFQHFIIVDKKLKKYVLETRYILHLCFEDFIEKNALSQRDKDFTFVSRRDEEDRVVLEFSFPEEKEIDKASTYFYTLAGDIPYSDGCEECKYLSESDCLFCEKKEKVLTNKLKNCKFFSQKGGEN